MEIFLQILIFIAFLLLGYIFGSIPNSVLIAKYFFHKDIMQEGSKNPGGTNAGRVLGKTIGVIVILLDGLKTVIPIYMAFFCFYYCDGLKNIMGYYNDTTLNVFGRGNTLCQFGVYLTALGAILGHCYSIFLNFKGGKAVSSYLATACCISYNTFILCGALFFGFLKLKKHVSLSSIISTAAFTLFSWALYITYAVTLDTSVIDNLLWFGQGPEICIYFPIVMTIGFIILVVRHRSNIKRLQNNTESKITWMK